MKKTALTIALTLIPAALMAQQAQTSTQAKAKTGVEAKGASVKTDASVDAKADVNVKRANGAAQASEHANDQAKEHANEHSAVAAGSTVSTSSGDVSIPDKFSADARAKLEASFKAAHDKNLPAEPMTRRIAEGQAKAATEEQIVASVQNTEARLEASQSALIRAGRATPSSQDIEAGEQAMEQGATEAQVEALAQHTPSDRSLSVAVDVLGKLLARGVPVSQALAQIQAKLDSGASDEALVSLAPSAATSATGAVNAHGGNPNAAGAAVNAAGNAAAGVTAGVKGLGGAAAGVTGAVTGAAGVKKP